MMPKVVSYTEMVITIGGEATIRARARGPREMNEMECRAIGTPLIGYCDYCYISGNTCEKLVRYLRDMGVRLR